MKTILITLLLSAFALCELPPPYPQRGFRPSPYFIRQFSILRQPQIQYGPPKLRSNNVDVQIPARLTIEQLIKLTEQLQSSQERIVINSQLSQLSTPQNSYLPPPRQPQQTYGPPNKIELSQTQLRPPPASNFGVSQPQNTYGTPQVSQTFNKPLTRPQNQYGPPQAPTSAQSVPHNTYGVPNVQQLPRPSQPSNFGAYNNQVNPPSTNYGVPDLRSLETFGEFRKKPQNDQDILRQNLLSDLSKQHLPYREPTGFRPQGTQSNEVQIVQSVNQQYLPANSGSPSNFESSQQGNINNNLQQSSQSEGNNLNYIPPSSGNGVGGISNPSRPQQFPDVNQQYLPANSGNGIQRPQNIRPENVPSNVPQSIGGGNIPSNVLQSIDGGNVPQSSASGNGGTSAGQNYLPPQTTSRAPTGSTTVRPRVQTTPVTPERTTNYDYDYAIQQPTESPSNQDDSASDPNVAVSNAVAGGGGFFYLQQPDGRLQRVVLQKTQEPDDKPEEYVANYYFQNIHALPSVTYAPLLSLGGWK